LQTQDRLKSFVLRKGRITSNQQRAIDSLWEKYIVDSTEELKNILPNTHPILDIGFGSGETTAYISKQKPETFVLGAEVYLSGIGSLLSKASEDSLENIRILNSDIAPFLEEKVSDNFFELILMFYPDPWPKRKHHKRRLINKDFIDLLNSKIRPEGIFYFKTDWSHYFQEVQKIVSKDKKWAVLEKKDLKNYLIDLPQTSFESKALVAKRELNELILQRIS
jgi:tRNA (guanine-N7-)-methyltransferase|tara:strand:- start:386 stop:1051 length:666 start_codon:yes stop_codon:yes gene_type:complete